MTRIAAVAWGVFFAIALGACQSRAPAPEAQPTTVAPPQPSPVPASPAERARAHNELAIGYYSIGNFGVALSEFREALKADANYVPALNGLGLVHMELKEDDKARASFERALKIDPTDPDTNNNFGLFLCNRGRERDAERYFLAAVKNPLYATPEDSYVNAGLCARRVGDIERAQGHFERALQLRPTDARALSALAQLAYARRDYARARSFLGRFMQLIPNPDAGSLWLGARIENQLGDRNATRSYGAQLKTRFPDADETRLFEQGRFD
jgi:type IV pilus assembly protein PilF